MAYFIFKLTRIWLPSDKRQYYIAVARPLTVFAAIDIVLIIITITVCILCSMNFKKGLREHLNRSKSTRKHDAEQQNKTYQQNYQHYQGYPQQMQQNMAYSSAPVPSRMTIE